MGFLVLIFLVSTAIAPVSSLWQTTQWVIVKTFEKSIWSCFAMAQAAVFGRWSRLMATDNSTLDAWLYIAIVPIIMNAFMFLMFSRISRLKLPCFAPKYNQRLEKERDIIASGHHYSDAVDALNPMLDEQSNNLNVSYTNLVFDKKEAFKSWCGIHVNGKCEVYW
eukprot:UN08857